MICRERIKCFINFFEYSIEFIVYDASTSIRFVWRTMCAATAGALQK